MGVPLRVLLDKHDRFMPATISVYYRFLYEHRHGCDAVHYPESETIWQAVSEATWIELEAYLDAFVQRFKERIDEVHRNWSYNLFSAAVRDDWKDLRRSHYAYDPQVYQIDEWTGFCRFRCREAPPPIPRVLPNLLIVISCSRGPVVRLFGFPTTTGIHANRKWYIEWYNKRYRKVRPALHMSDNLVVKLLPYGGLPSWAEPRRGWFRSLGPVLDFFHPGHLSNDEIRHLRRKGVHFGLDPGVGFKKIVDTRAESSTEVLGLPELLPDSKPAITTKAEDDLSKSGQERARALSRL